MSSSFRDHILILVLLCGDFAFVLHGEQALWLDSGLLAGFSNPAGPRRDHKATPATGHPHGQIGLLHGEANSIILVGCKLFLCIGFLWHPPTLAIRGEHGLDLRYVAFYMLNLGTLHALGETGLFKLGSRFHLPVVHYRNIRLIVITCFVNFLINAVILFRLFILDYLVTISNRYLMKVKWKNSFAL